MPTRVDLPRHGAIKFRDDAPPFPKSKPLRGRLGQRKALFEALAAEFQAPAHMLAGQFKTSFDRTAYPKTSRIYADWRRAHKAGQNHARSGSVHLSEDLKKEAKND